MPFISVVFCIGLIFGLAFWLWRSTADGRLLRFVFWPALTFRLLSGILLGYFYSKQIITGGDSWGFQKMGNMLTQVAKTDFQAYLDILLYNKIADPEIIKALPYPTYTNSFFLVKIVSLLNFFTANSYYLNGRIVSCFSFAGCWTPCRALA